MSEIADPISQHTAPRYPAMAVVCLERLQFPESLFPLAVERIPVEAQGVETIDDFRR